MKEYPFKTAESILHKKEKGEFWAYSFLTETHQTDVHPVSESLTANYKTWWNYSAGTLLHMQSTTFPATYRP